MHHAAWRPQRFGFAEQLVPPPFNVVPPRRVADHKVVGAKMAFHLRVHTGACIFLGGVGGALVRAGSGEVVYGVRDGEGCVGDVVDAGGGGEGGEVGG